MAAGSGRLPRQVLRAGGGIVHLLPRASMPPWVRKLGQIRRSRRCAGVPEDAKCVGQPASWHGSVPQRGELSASSSPKTGAAAKKTGELATGYKGWRGNFEALPLRLKGLEETLGASGISAGFWQNFMCRLTKEHDSRNIFDTSVTKLSRNQHPKPDMHRSHIDTNN